ncbi:MAG TPA: lactate utilization protein C [Jatrophihabitans sp.]|nr:lactate utilization protein C [Jatrophihabitans sp.]
MTEGSAAGGPDAGRRTVLDRIAAALADRPRAAEIPRDYRPAGAEPGVDLVELLTDRLVDYRAAVHRCPAAAAAERIGELVGDRSVVVPVGFPAELLTEVRNWRPDEPPLTVAELDQAGGVLSTCALAVAETGTLVLDAGPGQGRRALTLVPDYHLAVVRADQVVFNVPDAVERLAGSRTLTWISGPSATSDIELARVEGVHGPRTLVVLLLD